MPWSTSLIRIRWPASTVEMLIFCDAGRCVRGRRSPGSIARCACARNDGGRGLMLRAGAFALAEGLRATMVGFASPGWDINPCCAVLQRCAISSLRR